MFVNVVVNVMCRVVLLDLENLFVVLLKMIRICEIWVLLKVGSF